MSFGSEHEGREQVDPGKFVPVKLLAHEWTVTDLKSQSPVISALARVQPLEIQQR